MGNGEKAADVKEQVWLVLQRDLSMWLRDVDMGVYSCMMIDRTNPGNSVEEGGETPGEAFRNVLTMAAEKRAQRTGLPLPDRIQVPTGLAETLHAELPQLARDAGFRPDVVIEEVTPEDGAERVFDYSITEPAGRRLPENQLLSEDAIFLYGQARRFMEAEPWTRWTPEDAQLLELTQASQTLEGVAGVMGHEFTQPGVLLLPLKESAITEIGARTRPPVGTLMMQLEGAEIQPELFI